MINFRKITEKDYNILAKCMKKAAFDDDTQMHTELIAGGPCGYDDGTLLYKLNNDERMISRLIEYNQEIVEAYVIFPHNDQYVLDMLFIDPTYKNKGIGTMVWNYIESTYNTKNGLLKHQVIH